MKTHRGVAQQDRRGQAHLLARQVSSGLPECGAQTRAPASPEAGACPLKARPSSSSMAASSVTTCSPPLSDSSGRTSARPSACRAASTSSTGFLPVAATSSRLSRMLAGRESKPARAAVAAAPFALRPGSAAWAPVPRTSFGWLSPSRSSSRLVSCPAQQLIGVLLDDLGQMRGQHRGLIDHGIAEP